MRIYAMGLPRKAGIPSGNPWHIILFSAFLFYESGCNDDKRIRKASVFCEISWLCILMLRIKV